MMIVSNYVFCIGNNCTIYKLIIVLICFNKMKSIGRRYKTNISTIQNSSNDIFRNQWREIPRHDF